jgi:hypothetical protein
MLHNYKGCHYIGTQPYFTELQKLLLHSTFVTVLKKDVFSS